MEQTQETAAPEARLNVLMIGPSLAVKGGISTVEKLLISNTRSSVRYSHLATHVDGLNAVKILFFAGFSLPVLMFRLIFTRVDLVHVHFTRGASTFRKLLCITVCRLFHKDVIVHMHAFRYDDFYDALPGFLQEFTAQQLRKCARIIVLSEAWGHYYQECFGLEESRIVVMCNPVVVPDNAIADKHKDVREGKVGVLYLGIIDDRKGAFRLLRAYSELPPAAREASELTFAGNGDVDGLRRLAEEAGLSESVTVYDWIDEEQKDQILRRSEIFALPSRNEGLPMSLLEAVGYGLAVVSTPVGGIPELIKDRVDGILLDPDDIDALRDALEYLISHPEKRLTFVQSAFQAVEPYKLGTYLDNLYRLYREVRPH